MTPWQTKEAMTLGERLKLFMFRRRSDEAKARMVIDAYLSGNGNGTANSEFSKAIKLTPGLSSGMFRYLNGNGKDRIQDIVQKGLGDHWYTGIAKRLSNTDLGRNFVINKVLDRTLPRIGGSTDTAKWFLERGGHV